MINDKTVLAVIPARGGSKRVPKKNIKPIGGRPLIARTIEAAKKSRYIDRIIVSTDSNDIALVAEEWGAEVPFMRPKELATDISRSIDSIYHVMDSIDKIYDYIVLLQPTSPLRSWSDIDGCLETCLRLEAPACISVNKFDKSLDYLYCISNMGRIFPFASIEFKSNTLEKKPLDVCIINGAVYVALWRSFRKHDSFLSDDTVAYVMPQERSLDIDTSWDFYLGELILRDGKNNESK